VAEVVVRAFADLSIRTKLIVIVAGTLLLAQSLSAVLIREVVSKHILHQALTTVDILATSIQHDVTYDAQRDPQSDGQQIIAKYMTYYRMISSMAIYDHDMICTASSNPGDVKQGTRNHEVIDAGPARAAILTRRPAGPQGPGHSLGDADPPRFARGGSAYDRRVHAGRAADAQRARSTDRRDHDAQARRRVPGAVRATPRHDSGSAQSPLGRDPCGRCRQL
jgi:hypothetical protein